MEREPVVGGIMAMAGTLGSRPSPSAKSYFPKHFVLENGQADEVL
ncbi:MAG: hypothetical protein ACRDYE_14740 [Acidimicrobiales bacterium]